MITSSSPCSRLCAAVVMEKTGLCAAPVRSGWVPVCLPGAEA